MLTVLVCSVLLWIVEFGLSFCVCTQTSKQSVEANTNSREGPKRDCIYASLRLQCLKGTDVVNLNALPLSLFCNSTLGKIVDTLVCLGDLNIFKCL